MSFSDSCCSPCINPGCEIYLLVNNKLIKGKVSGHIGSNFLELFSSLCTSNYYGVSVSLGGSINKKNRSITLRKNREQTQKYRVTLEASKIPSGQYSLYSYSMIISEMKKCIVEFVKANLEKNRITGKWGFEWGGSFIKFENRFGWTVTSKRTWNNSMYKPTLNINDQFSVWWRGKKVSSPPFIFVGVDNSPMLMDIDTDNVNKMYYWSVVSL